MILKLIIKATFSRITIFNVLYNFIQSHTNSKFVTLRSCHFQDTSTFKDDSESSMGPEASNTILDNVTVCWIRGAAKRLCRTNQLIYFVELCKGFSFTLQYEDVGYEHGWILHRLKCVYCQAKPVAVWVNQKWRNNSPPRPPFIQEPSPRKNVRYVTPNSTDIYFQNVFLFYLNNPPSWGQLGL